MVGQSPTIITIAILIYNTQRGTMNGTGLHFDILIVFFVYGAAFFAMGLAMALESGRSSFLANANLLRPLAAFGILHGLHE